MGEAQKFGVGIASIALWLERRLTPVFVALAVLATAAGSAIACLIGASVAMRHIANAPFRFTEELTGLLMTAAFFLALPLVTLKAKHVRVHILVASLPDKISRWVAGLAGLFGVAFCVWFFVLCLPWLDFAFERNIKTEAARLLMYPWMALLPFSMLLTALAFGIRCATAGPGPEPETAPSGDSSPGR